MISRNMSLDLDPFPMTSGFVNTPVAIERPLHQK